MGNVPEKHYGVLQRDTQDNAIAIAAENIRRTGYTVFDPELGADQVRAIATAFDETRDAYQGRWGKERLTASDEHNSVRLPMAVRLRPFLDLAAHPELLGLIGSLIKGKFILNQQNGVINPAGKGYNQGAWHRDLPYQHFVSTSPLAVNALYCVDDFTLENGSTWVLPASHKAENFPSDTFIRQHAVQVTAKAGQFIVLDCMVFHSGGYNASATERRGLNHVYTIPYFKQQIRIPGNIVADGLAPHERALLGFDYAEPACVQEYLDLRSAR